MNADIEPSVHTPILVERVVELLGVRENGRYIDATANGGGHTRAILEGSSPDGRLLSIDRDPDLTARLRESLAAEVNAGRLSVENASFVEIANLAEKADLAPVDGVLFDLGLSSYHLDHSGRGFAFSKSEPLDMRFGTSEVETRRAKEIVARTSAHDLTKILRDYGEERFASRIARTIVSLRERSPIETSGDLFEAIERSLPANTRWRASRHAARVFQALRITVNDELDAIRRALPQAWRCLAPSGRIVVLSFHSLEDRIVKQAFRKWGREENARILTKKPLVAADDEIAANARAASAKMRAVEKSAVKKQTAHETERY